MIKPNPAQTRFMLQIPSTTEIFKWYHIIIDTETKFVMCSCPGCNFTGRCKHIKFYKYLIRRILHENPSLLGKKRVS